MSKNHGSGRIKRCNIKINNHRSVHWKMKRKVNNSSNSVVSSTIKNSQLNRRNGRLCKVVKEEEIKQCVEPESIRAKKGSGIVGEETGLHSIFLDPQQNP